MKGIYGAIRTAVYVRGPLDSHRADTDLLHGQGEQDLYPGGGFFPGAGRLVAGERPAAGGGPVRRGLGDSPEMYHRGGAADTDGGVRKGVQEEIHGCPQR